MAKFVEAAGHPAPSGAATTAALRTRGADFAAELEAYCEAYRRRVGSN